VPPQTDPNLHFRDRADALLGVYINDDRLGPYALAELYPFTDKDGGSIRTGLSIRWPDKDIEAEPSVLVALVVPVPTKLRLTMTRMRALALAIAEAAGQLFPEFTNLVTVNCRYDLGTRYRGKSPDFGLSERGLYELSCSVVLSRYVGIIEIAGPDGPLFDLLLDATEIRANPSALACVRRASLLPSAETTLGFIATKLGAHFIS